MYTQNFPALKRMIARSCLCATVLLSLAFSVMANQVVYKCGQEITNQPTDPKLCQTLNISQPTQIEGTRVQTSAQKGMGTVAMGASELTESAKAQASVVQAGPSAESVERKSQARTILEDEWQKLSTLYTELVQQYNHGHPTPLAGETIRQTSYQQRAMALKAQVQRLERDLQALQRELSRFGVSMTSPLSAATSK
jgi:hypothetical protein